MAEIESTDKSHVFSLRLLRHGKLTCVAIITICDYGSGYVSE